MKSVMINAKVDPVTKNQVDAVLKQSKTTASQIIRTLWGYIAENQCLPEVLATAPHRKPSATKRQKMSQLLSLSGIIQSAADTDYDQILLEELEARNA